MLKKNRADNVPPGRGAVCLDQDQQINVQNYFALVGKSKLLALSAKCKHEPKVCPRSRKYRI